MWISQLVQTACVNGKCFPLWISQQIQIVCVILKGDLFSSLDLFSPVDKSTNINSLCFAFG